MIQMHLLQAENLGQWLKSLTDIGDMIIELCQGSNSTKLLLASGNEKHDRIYILDCTCIWYYYNLKVNKCRHYNTANQVLVDSSRATNTKLIHNINKMTTKKPEILCLEEEWWYDGDHLILSYYQYQKQIPNKEENKKPLLPFNYYNQQRQE